MYFAGVIRSPCSFIKPYFFLNSSRLSISVSCCVTHSIRPSIAEAPSGGSIGEGPSYVGQGSGVGVMGEVVVGTVGTVEDDVVVGTVVGTVVVFTDVPGVEVVLVCGSDNDSAVPG